MTLPIKSPGLISGIGIVGKSSINLVIPSLKKVITDPAPSIILPTTLPNKSFNLPTAADNPPPKIKSYIISPRKTPISSPRIVIPGVINGPKNPPNPPVPRANAPVTATPAIEPRKPPNAAPNALNNA